MNTSFQRHIPFDAVLNFRDLGGYRTRDGYSIGWRNLYRSGELQQMTDNDSTRLREEIGLRTVIDLRSSHELEKHGTDYLTENGLQYYNIPFLAQAGNREKEREKLNKISNMGEFYLMIIKREGFCGHVLKALEIMAEPNNHPLVFHCTLGKDRTGILASMLLSILGVEDKDIINDYAMTADLIKEFVKSIRNDTEKTGFGRNLPAYFLEATRESMSLFLSTIQEEHGSVKGYLQDGGIDDSLVNRLKNVLLI